MHKNVPAVRPPRPTEVQPPSDHETSRIVARPDGYYWVADDGRQEFGPYSSALEALHALRFGLESGSEADELLADVEAETGIVEPPPEGGAEEE